MVLRREERLSDPSDGTRLVIVDIRVVSTPGDSWVRRLVSEVRVELEKAEISACITVIKSVVMFIHNGRYERCDACKVRVCGRCGSN